ncbi:hypothetical protein HELRODRAFT_178524 [Helobdella robusta]|uniref:Uncharacterized protein n=1 Tax=Helobdella robusta TaxID=6412 RepID=T1FDB0_HELRO|nr:hypothetical protein HELRODRAFT_178524 [Helobdella robusta]ESN97075.1 hypothetical protein HELRODRAFT_178524 [Helobdella robusta]
MSSNRNDYYSEASSSSSFSTSEPETQKWSKKIKTKFAMLKKTKSTEKTKSQLFSKEPNHDRIRSGVWTEIKTDFKTFKNNVRKTVRTVINKSKIRKRAIDTNSDFTMEKGMSHETLSSSSPTDYQVDKQHQHTQDPKPLPRLKRSQPAMQKARESSSSAGIQQQYIQAPIPMPRLKRSKQQPTKKKVCELADYSEFIQQQHIQAPKPQPRLNIFQKPKSQLQAFDSSSSAIYLEGKQQHQHQQAPKPLPRLKRSQLQPAKHQAIELQPQLLPRANRAKKQQNRPNERPQHENGASGQESNRLQLMPLTNRPEKQLNKTLESSPNITASNVMQITLKKLQRASKKRTK